MREWWIGSTGPEGGSRVSQAALGVDTRGPGTWHRCCRLPTAGEVKAEAIGEGGSKEDSHTGRQGGLGQDLQTFWKGLERKYFHFGGPGAPMTRAQLCPYSIKAA